MYFLELIYFYLQTIKWNVKLRKMSIFLLLLFVFNHGSKATKAADLYSGDFYQRGIEYLVECWEEVVINNEKYIID